MSPKVATFRGSITRVVPRWLRSGLAHKLLYAIALHADLLADAAARGVRKRFPGLDAPYDALPLLARERGIIRGRDETDAAHARRQQRWWDDRKRQGNPYGMLEQLHLHFAPNNFPIELIYASGRRYSLAVDGTITRDDVEWPTADLADVSYDSVSLSVSSETSSPESGVFSSDGTKLFVVGSAQQRVFQYDAATPFEVEGATYNGINFVTSGQTPTPGTVRFSPDGTKMFIRGGLRIYEYTLTTPWDIDSGVVYGGVFVDLSIHIATGGSFTLSNDGLRLYAVDVGNQVVRQYTLPTAFSLVGITHDGVLLDVSAEDSEPKAIAFMQDGAVALVLGGTNDTIYQYTLPTPWTFTGATYSGISLSVAGQDSLTRDLSLTASSGSVLMVGASNDRVYQFSFPTRLFPPGDHRWWLFYHAPQFAIPDGNWDDPGTWDDGGVWDSGLSVADVADLRLVPHDWNAYHAIGHIVLLDAGEEFDTYGPMKWPAQLALEE